KSGWCSNFKNCHRNHNIDSIINRDQKVFETKVPEKLEKDDFSNETNKDHIKLSLIQKSTHRAGFDSFMCGYSFLVLLMSNENDEENWFGKISLPGFGIPLSLTPSSYYKNSEQFIEYHKKMQNIIDI
ncbi:MAG: Target of EGR1, member 1 (Nuclear), partial [Paramarteilia canceri]